MRKPEEKQAKIFFVYRHWCSGKWSFFVLFADAAIPASWRKATTYGPRAVHKPTVRSKGNTNFVFESSLPCWIPVDVDILLCAFVIPKVFSKSAYARILSNASEKFCNNQTFPFVAWVHIDWVSLNVKQCDVDHTANQNKVENYKKPIINQNETKHFAWSAGKAVKSLTLFRCCIWLVHQPLEKLTPSSKPIKCEDNNLFSRVFPRSTHFVSFYFEVLTGSL